MTDDDELLTIAELAPLLGLAVATLRSDVSRRPQVLPPRVIFPCSRRVVWRRGDVRKWIAKRVAKA